MTEGRQVEQQGFPPDLELRAWEGADPATVLKRQGDDQLAGLVITLAVIFNDLKNVLSALYQMSKRKPSRDHLTPALAEYSGRGGHILRWQAGLFQELMKVLGEHRPVIATPEFQALLKGLHSNAREAWTALANVAFAPGPVKEDKRSTAWLLQRIRNQVGFHYAASAFAAGYRHHFFGQALSDLNRRAVFSDGGSMEETRFYFADAAAEGALATGVLEAAPSFADLEARITTVAKHVNMALKHIVVAYVRNVDSEVRPFEVSGQ